MNGKKPILGKNFTAYSQQKVERRESSAECSLSRESFVIERALESER